MLSTTNPAKRYDLDNISRSNKIKQLFCILLNNGFNVIVPKSRLTWIYAFKDGKAVAITHSMFMGDIIRVSYITPTSPNKKDLVYRDDLKEVDLQIIEDALLANTAEPFESVDHFVNTLSFAHTVYKPFKS